MERTRGRRYILALLLSALITSSAATWHGGKIALPTVSSQHLVIAGGGDPILPR
jgi:hypothetical protein